MDLRPVALAAVTALVLVRLFELWLNRRHVLALRAQGAVYHGAAGLRLIVVAQTAFVAGLALEGVILPPHPATNAATAPLLGLALGALALRHWCIATLGDHWTIAVFTVPGKPLVRKGPYRFLRHPNYAAVAVEFIALTAALQAWLTLVVAGALLLPALVYRIQQEDRALGSQNVETVPRQTS